MIGDGGWRCKRVCIPHDAVVAEGGADEGEGIARLLEEGHAGAGDGG